jgi:carbon monoxide dehydrogenase subunit G
MRVTGQGLLSAPVTAVYAALLEPSILRRVIPGCERITVVAEDRYRMTIGVGIASLSGRFDGDLRVENRQEPYSFLLSATGSGALGAASARVAVALVPSPELTTTISYSGDVTADGALRGLGDRIMMRVARRVERDFFAALDKLLRVSAGQERASSGH